MFLSDLSQGRSSCGLRRTCPRNLPFRRSCNLSRRTLSSSVFLLLRIGPEVRRVHVALSTRPFRPIHTTTVPLLSKQRQSCVTGVYPARRLRGNDAERVQRSPDCS